MCYQLKAMSLVPLFLLYLYSMNASYASFINISNINNIKHLIFINGLFIFFHGNIIRLYIALQEFFPEHFSFFIFHIL